MPEKSAYPTAHQQSVTFAIGIMITMRENSMAVSKIFSATPRLAPEFKKMNS